MLILLSKTPRAQDSPILAGEEMSVVSFNTDYDSKKIGWNVYVGMLLYMLNRTKYACRPMRHALHVDFL